MNILLAVGIVILTIIVVVLCVIIASLILITAWAFIKPFIKKAVNKWFDWVLDRI